MPENLGKITAKNAKRSHAVDAGRSKRPLRKLNSKFDSVASGRVQTSPD